METSKLIITILTSSVISAALTSYINWIIQKNNYKNDYFKKLIEKRLKSYEAIGVIIEEFKSVVSLEGGAKFHGFFCDGYDETILAHKDLIREINVFWLNEGTKELFYDFCNLIHDNIINEIKPDKRTEDKQLITLATKNYQQIEKIRLELVQTIKSDFMQLHNLEKFIKYDSML